MTTNPIKKTLQQKSSGGGEGGGMGGWGGWGDGGMGGWGGRPKFEEGRQYGGSS